MTHSEHCWCADLTSRTLHDQKYASLIVMILGMSIGLPMVGYSQADHAAGVSPKAFIDYFRPIPVSGKLSKEVWGAATVGPRDPKNGLEDTTMKQWDYWDGKILREAGRQIPDVCQPLGPSQGTRRLVCVQGCRGGQQIRSGALP